MLRHKILNEFQDYKTKEQIKPTTGDGYYKPRDAEQLSRLVSAECLSADDTRSERPQPVTSGLGPAAADTGAQSQPNGAANNSADNAGTGGGGQPAAETGAAAGGGKKVTRTKKRKSDTAADSSGNQ